MQLIVNGKPTDFDGDPDIATVIEQLGAGEHHVAVMVNGRVLSREDWNVTELRDSDSIEVIAFAGGG